MKKAKPAKTARKKAPAAKAAPSPQAGARQIDAKIAALGDWRGEMLARVRALIREACPDVTETVKWKKPSNPHGVPVWEQGGILCTGEIYKGKVKLTFAKGVALKDPSRLFNSSLDGTMRRAIDLHEGDTLNAAAFKTLIRAAASAAKRS
jgi:hypothetical protein